MKSNINIIIIAIIAAAIGLGIGYFVFGKNQKVMAAENHQHEKTMEESTDETIWTCSMHPQIRQNEPGLCPICAMDLIPLGTKSSNDPLVLEMTEEAVKLSNIQTTTIGAQTSQLGKTIRLSGKVQADERRASSLVAHVPGRIEKLYVSFTGEQVRKGQKLATIYSPELITAQRELLEAVKLKDLNPGLLEAARNKLRFWKIGNTNIEAIEKNASIQETFDLYAESSGIVTNKRVALGDYLKKGEPLFDLINLKKVWVLFDAYEDDLQNISVGNKIEFTAASIPNKMFKTNITFIDPMINPNTRTAAVRTEVNNSNGLLKPELFVNGTLQNKSTNTSQLTIPKSAVLWTGKRSVVYVKLPDTTIPSFEFREVELGDAIGESYQIAKGLKTGEEVVTYGSFSIDAAAQLNNQASMMNRNVRIKKEASHEVPNYQAETPTEFKDQLKELVARYIDLKDALVATDAGAANPAAEKVINQLENVDMSLLKGDAHLFWMEQLNALQAHSKKITELGNIEEQRRQFRFLSDALILSVQAFGTTIDSLYAQHCPMVNSNEGADWLALEKAIQNPYFGDKMMTCGIVKKVLTKNNSDKPPMKQDANEPQSNIHNH